MGAVFARLCDRTLISDSKECQVFWKVSACYRIICYIGVRIAVNMC